MTAPPTHLAAFHGDALDAALQVQYVTALESVTVGPHTWSLRKPANADTLITEADYVLDERLPYWADLWPSARVLAATLLAEPGDGRTLLELGCGLGLTTLGAMQAGFHVTATDYYVDALHVTRRNAQANLGYEPSVRHVNWRAWPEDLGQFDVVVAADVLYEKEYATLVGACIARAMTPTGEALIADPGRLALPAFKEALPSHGLQIVDATTTRYEAGTVRQDIQVMRLRHI